jgi:hypothetical protein
MNDQSRIDLTNRATTWLLQQIDAGVPPATAVQEFDLSPEAAEAVVRQAEVYLRCFDRLALILAGLAPQGAHRGRRFPREPRRLSRAA